MKLGKKPATYDGRDLRLADYRVTSHTVPHHPPVFGHEKLVQTWGVLGNDNVGDCVFAGAAHETMLWTAEALRPASFTDTAVLADYSAVTGYVPGDESTDRGTDVRQALKYRRKTGIVDAHGMRHQLGAYVALEPGHWEQVLEALWLFGAVGVGLQFPSSAMDQFDAGRAWSVVSGSGIEGGHYVPLVAYRARLWCVTWGKLQAMTKSFFEKYCDEAFGLLSPEMLRDGKSPEGFDLTALQTDLRALAA